MPFQPLLLLRRGFFSCGPDRLLNRLLPDRAGTEPLAEALRACRVHFLWAAGFSAAVNILYLTPTLYMMQVYDRVVTTGGLTTLVLVSVAAAAALGTLALLDWLRGRMLVRAGLRLDRLLSGRILSRVIDIQSRTPNTQAMREFDNVHTAAAGRGGLSRRARSDFAGLDHRLVGPVEPGRGAGRLRAS